MNKAELVDCIAEETGLSKAASGRALEAMMSGVRDALCRGDHVTLVGFGTFLVGRRAPRNGRNPRTGRDIRIDGSKVAKFRAGKALKDAIK